MKHENVLLQEPPDGEIEPDLGRWRGAGAALSRVHPDSRPRARKKKSPPDRRKRVRALVTRAAARPASENARWVIENFRLIYSTEKESREFALTTREMRTIDSPSGGEMPRVCMLAHEYLEACGCHYREAELMAFVEGFQEYRPLDNSEVWNLKPALELELIDRITEGDAGQWPTLLTSLRRIGETSWREIFEALSNVNRMLGRDPAGAYARMDFESRDRYRKTIADLARRSDKDETEVTECGAASGARAGERHFRRLARGHAAHACGLLPGGQGTERPRRNTGLPRSLASASSEADPEVSDIVLPDRNRTGCAGDGVRHSLPRGHSRIGVCGFGPACASSHADGGRFHEPSG